ncbi:peptidase domain-containing ABC transporter [Marivirga tractuosa]|uniref:peptidase domain-containing ABC transporter n=1 Tax=Marivirga tractuosa TaxID=1006 RepID=UPI0035CFF21C
MKFHHYSQHDTMDCGPTCLRMITRFYGKFYSLQSLRHKSGINKEGVSLLGISEAAEELGFRSLALRANYDKLKKEGVFPFIAFWNDSHFIVVYQIKGDKVYVADPAKTKLIYSKAEFLAGWSKNVENGQEPEGIALFLEPTSKFYEIEDEGKQKISFSILFKYLFKYKKLLVQLIIGLVVGSLLQLIIPFLTQSIVDVGINTRDVDFIYLILIAQMMLFIGQTSVNFVQSWVLLHINTRINISILSDFLIKLMRLPISFFDTKLVGDIIQRMGDHQRIQNFLTKSTLNTLFSAVNFFVFMIVIIIYNFKIFLVFLTGSVAYIIWVLAFMRYRKKLDYKQFDASSQNQGKIIQLINGMQEIKMNNCEVSKRWEWERIQARLFKVSIKQLALAQYQQGGGFIINQSKNIFITFFSAMAVIEGDLTLGAMLAIQYIIGQLNAPIEQFILFIQSAQDAMISLERLNEIHNLDDEEPNTGALGKLNKISYLPENKTLLMRSVSFSYEGAGNENILNNINLIIPAGKMTAIVGASGSGKTTLLKLLLKYYSPTNGEIKIANNRLDDVSNKTWRKNCGVVMQDSYIFSDSIANNIAIGDEEPNIEQINNAISVANCRDFIEALPQGLNTIIGEEGNGLSQGQRQRILIARAVYKNPQYIFFDEATNSLDANNEAEIMSNLNDFFVGKTVIVAAHRLSTVKNAHQLIVLDKGEIIEKGNHDELTNMKGSYFELVKNQFELEV